LGRGREKFDEVEGKLDLCYYNNNMTKAAKILLPYENKWVALNKNKDKVLASAKDVKVLGEKLEAKKVKKGEAILTWVFPFSHSIAPSNV
jgi:hypothetical protein